MLILTPDSTIPFSSFVDPFPLNTGSLNAFSLLNVIPSYRYLARTMLTQSHALLQNIVLIAPGIAKYACLCEQSCRFLFVYVPHI